VKNNIITSVKKRLYSPDLEGHRSYIEKKKSILLSIFFFLLIVIMVFFILLGIFLGDYSYTVIDISVLAFFVFLYFLFRIKKQLVLTSHIFVYILCSFALFYLITGGVNNTGLIFIVLLPIPVIMLMGRRSGVLVLSVFFIISLVILSVSQDASWCAIYRFDYSLRIFISFVIITILAYLNESVFDILYTRLQNTADSLHKSREDYKTLSMNREKFLSIISHDLKNQSAGFYSATDLLKNHYHEMEEKDRSELIEMLWENSQKNVQLLQGLLKWSMLKSNTFPYNPVPVKLEKVYREVIELFDLEIEKKNISVFLKIKSNSEVFADYYMLNAIMRNLLSNAVRYTGNNGEIRIISEEKGDFMNIEVRDNGPGIDPLTLESLRTSVPVRSGNEEGSGIGLILVREFVECNKGKLIIDTQLKKGTCISFTVPLVE
jgi:signal transduction histidine kinase